MTPAVSQRYQWLFDGDLASTQDTRVPRGVPVWRCKRCGLAIRPNPVGAASHAAKHIKDVTDPRPS